MFTVFSLGIPFVWLIHLPPYTQVGLSMVHFVPVHLIAKHSPIHIRCTPSAGRSIPIPHTFYLQRDYSKDKLVKTLKRESINYIKKISRHTVIQMSSKKSLYFMPSIPHNLTGQALCRRAAIPCNG